MADFKQIKQELQQMFKAVKTEFKNGAPDPITARRFADKAVEAAENLPRGRELADAFKAYALAVADALDNGDQASAEEAFDQLKEIRSGCHRQYMKP